VPPQRRPSAVSAACAAALTPERTHEVILNAMSEMVVCHATTMTIVWVNLHSTQRRKAAAVTWMEALPPLQQQSARGRAGRPCPPRSRLRYQSVQGLFDEEKKRV